MDFEEFMTILGPKLLSSDNREGFLGNTIDNIFWQVKEKAGVCFSLSSSFTHPPPPPHPTTLAYLCNSAVMLKHRPSFWRDSAQAHTYLKNTLSDKHIFKKNFLEGKRDLLRIKCVLMYGFRCVCVCVCIEGFSIKEFRDVPLYAERLSPDRAQW